MWKSQLLDTPPAALQEAPAAPVAPEAPVVEESGAPEQSVQAEASGEEQEASAVGTAAVSAALQRPAQARPSTLPLASLRTCTGRLPLLFLESEPLHCCISNLIAFLWKQRRRSPFLPQAFAVGPTEADSGYFLVEQLLKKPAVRLDGPGARAERLRRSFAVILHLLRDTAMTGSSLPPPPPAAFAPRSSSTQGPATVVIAALSTLLPVGDATRAAVQEAGTFSLSQMNSSLPPRMCR